MLRTAFNFTVNVFVMKKKKKESKEQNVKLYKIHFNVFNYICTIFVFAI